jgi:hypothetical protein
VNPLDIASDRQGNLVVVGFFDGQLDFGAGAMMGGQIKDAFVAKLRPDGSALWSKRFGGNAIDDDVQEAHRVTIDAEGNILIAGFFIGTIDLGGGPLVSAGRRDAFVVKLDASGNHVWSKRFGNTSDQRARGIAADPAGNVFLAGTAFGAIDFGAGPVQSAGLEDIFLAKLDRNGQHIWSKLFGDAQTQEAWDLATDGEGNVAMAAYVLGNVDFGDGMTLGGVNPDAAVVKVSASGATLWSHRFGDQQHQFGQSIAIDRQGDVVLAGSMQGVVDFGDGQVQSSGAHDLLVVKLASSGSVRWYRRYGGEHEQPSLLVAVDAADAVVLTGFFLGTLDFGSCPLVAPERSAFAAKLDSAGNTLWSQRLGDTVVHVGTGVTAGPMGDVFVVGLSSEIGKLTSAAFVTRFDP